MTGHDITYDSHRSAVIVTHRDADGTWRLTIPGDLLAAEVGKDSAEAQRLDWVRTNLPGILTALTARREGGYVDPPWDRVLVAEVE